MQQKYGPNRRELMTMVFDEMQAAKINMESAAVLVCDCLTNRWKYEKQLDRFKQQDARRMAMRERWDQLKEGRDTQ